MIWGSILVGAIALVGITTLAIVGLWAMFLADRVDY